MAQLGPLHLPAFTARISPTPLGTCLGMNGAVQASMTIATQFAEDGAHRSTKGLGNRLTTGSGRQALGYKLAFLRRKMSCHCWISVETSDLNTHLFQRPAVAFKLA
jgi:hypothetical protein